MDVLLFRKISDNVSSTFITFTHDVEHEQVGVVLQCLNKKKLKRERKNEFISVKIGKIDGSIVFAHLMIKKQFR